MSTLKTFLLLYRRMLMEFLQGAPKEKFAELQPQNHDAALRKTQEKLVEVSMCPDFIEDRGHTYGRSLSDQDKQALIEYMKYF